MTFFKSVENLIRLVPKALIHTARFCIDPRIRPNNPHDEYALRNFVQMAALIGGATVLAKLLIPDLFISDISNVVDPLALMVISILTGLSQAAAFYALCLVTLKCRRAPGSHVAPFFQAIKLGAANHLLLCILIAIAVNRLATTQSLFRAANQLEVTIGFLTSIVTFGLLIHCLIRPSAEYLSNHLSRKTALSLAIVFAVVSPTIALRTPDFLMASLIDTKGFCSAYVEATMQKQITDGSADFQQNVFRCASSLEARLHPAQ